MSHIYQHKTLGRPVDSRKNKGIGEIAVPRKSNINTANKKIQQSMEFTYINNDKNSSEKHSFKQ